MELCIADLQFAPLLSSEAIQARVKEIAAQINIDYEDKTPIIVGVLNGSFLFMADLVKEITVPCEIAFTKLASYFGGTMSTRKIRDDFDLNVDITGRDIILIEDIVDTGHTITYLLDKLQVRKPASINVCSLLLKRGSLECRIDEPAYIGFEIKNEFVVGYGLDYQGLGRNLNGIYVKIG